MLYSDSFASGKEAAYRGGGLRTSLYCGAAAFTLMFGAAQAQTGDTSSAANDSSAIVVTGTQLRGVAPVGSPVIAVDRKEIDAVGAITTTQILKLQPQVLNLGITDTQRTGTGGAGISPTALRSTCADLARSRR
jgi:hypothetical protein